MSARLIYVVNTPWFFVSHRLVLAEAARDRGFHVTIVTPDGPGVSTIQSRGLDWHPVDIDRGGMNPFRDMRTIAQLVSIYRRLKPDVVHHVTPKPVLYGTLAARIARVPQVINAVSGMGFMFTAGRHGRQKIGRQLYRFCLRHPAMRVIVQNGEDMALMRDQSLVDPNTLTLIPGSGVDVDRFRPVDRSQSVPMVVQTSRMLADKGVREFIAAARSVRRDFPTVRFVLVGDTDEGNPSSLRAAELNAAAAEGVIEWWGGRQDIERVLDEATIYCLPSYREGLPKSLIEAAAAGLPLITTSTSGCAEVVRHGQNGLLVPVGDARALAEAIMRLLAEPGLASKLGQAARQSAEQRFAVSHILRAQLDLYKVSEGGSQGALKRVCEQVP